jgi:glycosyltransferase involved in cell wall biosynthesis
LARELAKLGHDVFFITKVSKPGRYDGVECLSWGQSDNQLLHDLHLDAFVVIIAAGFGVQLRQALGPEVRLILWNQHAHDQPGVKALIQPAERQAYSGMAMVSQWQLSTFQQVFGIDPGKMAVLRNAIAPAFADQFPAGSSILEHKAQPPILAYTSTPFRGLDLLVEAFGAIRQEVPGTRLQVFSSMQVYAMTPAQDQANFGALYERCRQTPGVEYVGSLPQPQLAKALRGVSVLAYPNIFPETSCIAVMEAMASGCRIVTSAMGALPETTGGFAHLIPLPQSRADYLRLFVERTVQALRENAAAPEAVETLLKNQLAFVQTQLTWPVRAVQWVQWLKDLKP